MMGSWATLERGSCTKNMTSTGGCSYSFVYCWWWVAWPRWREVAAQKIWPVPEAVVTVLCTPDNGYIWHPKHVEWTCRIINRLLCVSSLWTVINISIPNFVIIFELLMDCRKSQTEEEVSRCAVWKMSCANTKKTQGKRGSASNTGSDFGIS